MCGRADASGPLSRPRPAQSCAVAQAPDGVPGPHAPFSGGDALCAFVSKVMIALVAARISSFGPAHYQWFKYENVRWPRIYVGWPFLTPPSGPRGKGRVRPSSDAPGVTASPREAKAEQASSPGFAEAIFGGPNDPQPCVGAPAWATPVLACGCCWLFVVGFRLRWCRGWCTVADADRRVQSLAY